MKNKVLIIGAGSAGIGMGVLLKKMQIPFQILERDSVGASFKKWPKEMRFISPSFTGNFFSSPDLNAITPDTSPAYTLKTEHPTGAEYAKYLKLVSDLYELPVQTGVDVKNVNKKADKFSVETNRGNYGSNFVIWAAGEYQYPKIKSFEGSDLCIHNSKIKTWKKLKGDSFTVIGAYESGMDAAYQLSKLGKMVHLIDSQDQLVLEKSDSSYTLSPFTRDRYNEYKTGIKISTNTRVTKVVKEGSLFKIYTDGGEIFESKTQPILATGFESSLTLVEDLFEFDNGFPQLSECDESTKTAGLFLSGPQVKHEEAIFCFIYKFRQRFAVVAEEIALRLGVLPYTDEIIEDYRKNNFYLSDLSCCADECVC